MRRLFPEGVPPLWCPLLTHYTPEGAIDKTRIAAHCHHLSPYVKGFLIPGSTSDGWELNDDEFWQLLEIALELTKRHGLHLMVGVLKSQTRAALKHVLELQKHLASRSGEQEPEKILAKTRVCGFTVCAPSGKQVSQQEMERGLIPILETGLPIALYQLPQITQNEISPELIGRLADQFSNLLFFKDSSGTDQVVLSGRDLKGVFTMRGAEGQYAYWPKVTGGRYDGFLLSTANCLPAALIKILNSSAVDRAEISELSARVTALVNGVFEIVKTCPDGNAFANANKAIDHFFAFGPSGADLPGPRLHAGSRLPDEMLRKSGELLLRHGFMPSKGYLE